MTRLRGLLGVWCVTLLLAACGGGGGGGGSDGDGVSAGSGVTFAPPVLTANVMKGQTSTLTVVATAAESSGINGSVYAVVVDPQGVLTGTANIVALTPRSYSATLYTSPSLPVGQHKGSLQVRLCRDVACASEYPGSPLPLPYDITVTGAPLVATADMAANATVGFSGTVRTKATVAVVVEQLAWTASTAADWLAIEQGAGTGSGSFAVAFNAAGKPVGTYADVVRVRTSDNQTVDLPFTLTVLPKEFVMTSGVPAFSAVNGADIPAAQISFQLSSETLSPWTAATPTPWLSATPLQGTTPATVTLKADASVGPLASGIHDGQLVLSAQGVPDKVINTRLTLIKPTMTASANAVTLGGDLGRDLTAKTVQIALNTQTTSWPWTVTGAPNWVDASGSGQVSATGMTLSFTPNANATTAGSVSSSATMSAYVNGDTVSLPLTVNLNRDQRRLLPSAWGVGFAQTAAGSLLTRTLKVADNFGKTLPWTAVSSQPWLTATAAGDTGATSSLVLTADPAALANETLSEATVTLNSSTAGVDPAVVRVALWKSASGAANAVIAPAAEADRIVEIAADPVRPLVYAHAGGTALDVYHAYTGQKLTTIANVGAALGVMSVSPDGSLLYVLDTPSSKMAVVDLATRTRTAQWPLVLQTSADTSLLAIRPNGVEVVLVGHGKAYSQGKSLGDTGIKWGSLAATADGRHVYAQDRGYSPAQIYSYDVDYSAISGGVFMVKPLKEGWFVNGSSNGQDVAVQPDGSAVYTATGAPYKCSWLKPDTLQLVSSLPGGDAYPHAVEVTYDGRVICGITARATPDFWVHSREGAILTSHTLSPGYGSVKREGLVVPGDGAIVAVATESGSLQFVWIGH